MYLGTFPWRYDWFLQEHLMKLPKGSETLPYYWFAEGNLCRTTDVFYSVMN